MTKKILYHTSSIFAGILILFILLSVGLKLSIFNPDFHKYLFIKNDIYIKTENILKSSIIDYQKKLAKISPQYQEQQKDFFALVQKSTTLDFIKMNLERITDGFFAYLKNENTFLPDIYLNTAVSTATTKDSVQSDVQSTIDYSKIKKINLSTVLLYLNRNDISDEILFFKLLYNANNLLPQLSVLALLFVFVVGFITCKNLKEISRWGINAILYCGMLATLSGIALFYYYFHILPQNIYPLALSLPFDQNTILSYIRTLIFPVALISLSLGCLFITSSCCLIKFLKPMKQKGDFCASLGSMKHKSSLASITYISLLIIVSIAIVYKFYSIKNDFYSNDYAQVLSRRYTDTSTQIISAKKDTVYNLVVKLIDKEKDTLLSNIQVYVTGLSEDNKRFDELIFTDESGEAKLELDKGNFRISFPDTSSLSKYQIPAPYFVELKKAGSTIVTISLDSSDEETKKIKWGIAEIEILDNNNKPVENIELNLANVVPVPGNPDRIYSVSNSKGIAVFKADAGSYKVNFTQTKFPAKYQIPVPFDISVIKDSITRYTIRLEENFFRR